MSYLTLKWNCPYGGYSGFDIEIFNGTWTKKQQSQFCGREGSEEIFKTEPLDYYKTYTVSVTTVSDGLTSLPVQKICKTSITGKHQDQIMEDIYRKKNINFAIAEEETLYISIYIY